MKNLNRILSLILVLGMIAALFAGCGNQLQVETTNPPTVGDDTVETDPVEVEDLSFAAGTVLRIIA